MGRPTGRRSEETPPALSSAAIEQRNLPNASLIGATRTRADFAPQGQDGTYLTVISP